VDNINQRWCFNQTVFVVENFGKFGVNSYSCVSLVFIILASFLLQGLSHYIEMCLLAELRLEYQMSFTILQFYTVLHAHISSSFHKHDLNQKFLMFCDVIQFCPDNIVWKLFVSGECYIYLFARITLCWSDKKWRGHLVWQFIMVFTVQINWF